MKEFLKAYFAPEKGRITDLAERADLAAKEAGIAVPDMAEIRDEIREWLFENRAYRLEEYYTGRVLMSQKAESARRPVEEDSDKYDQLFVVKTKNFTELRTIIERVLELETELFGGDEVLIKQAEAKYKGKDIDKKTFTVLS
jgi:hypothetical protein